MTNPTAEEVERRLVAELAAAASAYIAEETPDNERRFTQAENAVRDLAERRHVKLETLSLLFPIGR